MAKTKTFVVNKKKLLEILKTQPLAGGTFVHQDGCTTCAVGAVLKDKLGDALNTTNDMDFGCEATRNAYVGSPQRIPGLLKEGNYLGALSTYFENIVNQDEDEEGVRAPITYRERRKLLNFVEKKFPKAFRFTVTI